MGMNVIAGTIMPHMERPMKMTAIKHVLVTTPRSVAENGGTVFTKQVRCIINGTVLQHKSNTLNQYSVHEMVVEF